MGDCGYVGGVTQWGWVPCLLPAWPTVLPQKQEPIRAFRALLAKPPHGVGHCGLGPATWHLALFMANCVGPTLLGVALSTFRQQSRWSPRALCCSQGLPLMPGQVLCEWVLSCRTWPGMTHGPHKW